MAALEHGIITSLPITSLSYRKRDVAFKDLRKRISDALVHLNDQHDLYLTSLPAAEFFPWRRFIPAGVVYDVEVVSRETYNDHEIESHVAGTALEICKQLRKIVLDAYQQLTLDERITQIEFLIQQTPPSPNHPYQIYKRVTLAGQPTFSPDKNS